MDPATDTYVTNPMSDAYDRLRAKYPGDPNGVLWHHVRASFAGKTLITAPEIFNAVEDCVRRYSRGRRPNPQPEDPPIRAAPNADVPEVFPKVVPPTRVSLPFVWALQLTALRSLWVWARNLLTRGRRG